jgi:hypothetical protein
MSASRPPSRTVRARPSAAQRSNSSPVHAASVAFGRTFERQPPEGLTGHIRHGGDGQVPAQRTADDRRTAAPHDHRATVSCAAWRQAAHRVPPRTVSTGRTIPRQVPQNQADPRAYGCVGLVQARRGDDGLQATTPYDLLAAARCKVRGGVNASAQLGVGAQVPFSAAITRKSQTGIVTAALDSCRRSAPMTASTTPRCSTSARHSAAQCDVSTSACPRE